MTAMGNTIAAAASPSGRSPRAMIRLSGSDLAPVIDQLFGVGSPIPPRCLSPCRLRLSGFRLPVLVTHYPAPRSYTGEDTLEIQLPGNPALLDRVIAMLTEQRNIRPAHPGEFTQRAYLNGHIDLTKAEGIAATIAAVSDAQLQAAALLRHGRLGQWATSLVDQLAHLLALVEAGIDFVDQEDVVAITPGSLLDGLTNVRVQVTDLLARSRSWRQIESLPWVVLVGQPNVGKSTLFNALLGHERAVISDIAGTTRDVLAEPLRLCVDGHEAEVMLVDIAGLEDTDAGLNPMMQQAARDAIAKAELILRLTDGDMPAPPPPRHDVATLTVRTKCDQPAQADTFGPPLGYEGAGGGSIAGHELRFSSSPSSAPQDNGDNTTYRISAHTGAGLDQLRQAINQRLGQRAVTLAGEMLALQPRHETELNAALGAIRDAIIIVTPQRDQPALADMELVADAMRTALNHLGQLGGEMTPDDVIGKVFATFCVGK